MKFVSYISKISLFFMFMFVIVSECAGLPGDKEIEGTGKLRKNVETVWNAKIKKDWGTVWDMTTGAFQKEMTRDQFIKRSNVNITKYAIKSVKVDAKKKTAVATVDFTFNQMGYAFDSVYKGKWQLENGEWRLDLLPSLKLPFGNN